MTTSSTEAPHQVLLGGAWRDASCERVFNATNPSTCQPLPGSYPVSAWSDVELALQSAHDAFAELQATPPEAIADFLRKYADLIDERADEIAAMAHLETGLPVEPRLKNAELPRTTGQLRQAADACLDTEWRLPTSDAGANLHSLLEAIGPVMVFGPNNFPLAFNGIAGGDFAAAIAAGCPVIAKAHDLHPGVSRMLAEAAQAAASDLPAGAVQMLYAFDHEVGFRAVSDPRLGAVAFTGSRGAGLKLKAAADKVGKPLYAELSSVNPVVFLPGALAERFDTLVDETVASALMGAGQFCTNPGLIVMIAGDDTDRFLETVAARYASAAPAPLLGERVLSCLTGSLEELKAAGAQVVAGGEASDAEGFKHQNTLLKTDGATFLGDPEKLQTEAFGNSTLVAVCDDSAQVLELIRSLEGGLTGCVYSATDGSEDALYEQVAAALKPCVGRLLNDKMPTGVAVSPAMNHGGPFPATGHPHFTAVGLPAACRRFTRLVCYDNVRPHRLPAVFK